MASLTRPMTALRIRLPLSMVVRFNSTTPSAPAAEENNNAEASSSSEVAAAAAASSLAESNTDTPYVPPPRNHNFVPEMTPYGPTNSYNGPDVPIPRSAQLLPLHPAPQPPWADKPLGIYHINYPRPLFPTPKKEDYPEILGGNSNERRMKTLSAITGMTVGELRNLRRITAEVKYVVNMTKKGKMRSSLAYVLVGNPEKGMVGLGRGRGNTPQKAVEDAFYEACLNMDAVNRYEDRTLWGQGKELYSKFGSCKVSLRARPPGHGLMVPHSVHRVLTCCGIRDASAQIDGSTHPILVMKAVLQLLHGGGNPPWLGTGTGQKGKRENKGHSMRSKEDIERQRGRYGVDIGLRV